MLPVLLAVLMVSPALGADVVPCIAPHVNSPVAVSEPGAASGLVYFRKQGTTEWYFIDLKSGPSGFYAVLPRPEEGTVVEYQVETTAASGNKRKGPATGVSPSPSCTPTLSPEQTSLASNLVVGKTVDATPDVPAGFECSGIVGALTTSGELRTVTCKKGGILLPVVIIGSAALGGGAYLIYKNNHREVSKSRP